MSDNSHNPLGQDSAYPNSYAPELLFPIARQQAREQLALGQALPFRGQDRWTAYELSWLDTSGKPQVRLAECVIAHDSPFIIESKSFKLYLNSFNQTQFASERHVKNTLVQDLSAVANAPVSVTIYPFHYAQTLAISEPIGTCLDAQDVVVEHYTPAPELLSMSSSGETVNEVVYSHLLKSNCPVTAQPDWATVFIEYRGLAMDYANLLRYLISFRDHQDFHENCVERIFCDLTRQCQPESLAVYARYTRRGGLDINPLRSSYPAGKSLLEANTLRTVRQ